MSEYARGTQVSHVGGEPVVIPNGLYVDRFAAAAAAARSGAATDGTVAFVGRLGEPRKGFAAAGARRSARVAADPARAAAAGRRRRRRRRGAGAAAGARCATR